MGFWEEKRVLVTGGAGFLGRVVVDVLRRRECPDPIVARSAEFDLTDAGAADKLMAVASPDIVFHVAARVGGIGANMAAPADIYLTNLLMGTHVIEAARRHEVAKTVIVGSICSYPKFAPAPFSEASLWDGYPEETNAPYGIAKKALLVHAQANRMQYGQNCIFLMPTNLYGPGDNFDARSSHVIPALIRKCVEAKRTNSPTVDIWGTGNATREFLYVDDAAAGLVLAAERYHEPDPVNLGSGEEITIRDLAHLIARLCDYDGDFVWDRSKPDGQPRRLVDHSLARSAFGFEPQVRLEDGLKTTIDWYLAQQQATV